MVIQPKGSCCCYLRSKVNNRREGTIEGKAIVDDCHGQRVRNPIVVYVAGWMIETAREIDDGDAVASHSEAISWRLPISRSWH